MNDSAIAAYRLTHRQALAGATELVNQAFGQTSFKVKPQPFRYIARQTDAHPLFTVSTPTSGIGTHAEVMVGPTNSYYRLSTGTWAVVANDPAEIRKAVISKFRAYAQAVIVNLVKKINAHDKVLATIDNP